MASAEFINNYWFYGETGDRLSALRTTEIYKGSAKSITNMLVSDIGTLKVAKQFDSKELAIGETKRVIDTSEDVYIILTSINIHSVNKRDNTIKNTYTHSMGANVDMVLIETHTLCLFDGVNKAKYVDIKGGILNPISKKDGIKLPTRDRKVLQLDIWKVSQNPVETSKKRIIQMSSFTNPLLKVQDNNIYLHNSNIQIKRIYTTYNQVVDENYFQDPQVGDVYGILRVYYQPTDTDSYLIENTKVVPSSLQTDSKYGGQYFTQLTGTNSEGLFHFGKVIDITSPDIVTFFRDRTVYVKDNTLYFSKLRDYGNFRNGLEDDDPFYITLNPINYSVGRIKDIITSDTMYILTTAGIYVIGANNFILTPKTIGGNVMTATDMGVGDSYTVSNNILYFMNNNNILKAIIMDRTSQQLAYTPHTVDKYSVKSLFQDISRTTIEDKDYILARGKDNKSLYLIEAIDYNGLFRKVKLDFEITGKIFGLDDRFIMGNKVYYTSNRNYKKASIIVHPYSLNGNNILMDNSSSIDNISIKLVNEDKEAVEGVILNGIKIANIQNDMYSIYRAKTRFNVKNGFPIEILTKENDKECELLAIQSLATLVEDK